MSLYSRKVFGLGPGTILYRVFVACGAQRCVTIDLSRVYFCLSLDELLGEAPVPSVTVMIHESGISVNRRRMDGQTPTRTTYMDDENIFFY